MVDFKNSPTHFSKHPKTLFKSNFNGQEKESKCREQIFDNAALGLPIFVKHTDTETVSSVFRAAIGSQLFVPFLVF